MLTVDQYGQIRRAHRDGMGVREIARTFHHSRRKIREVLQQAESRPYTRQKPATAPKLAPFDGGMVEFFLHDESKTTRQSNRL